MSVLDGIGGKGKVMHTDKLGSLRVRAGQQVNKIIRMLQNHGYYILTACLGVPFIMPTKPESLLPSIPSQISHSFSSVAERSFQHEPWAFVGLVYGSIPSQAPVSIAFLPAILYSYLKATSKISISLFWLLLIRLLLACLVRLQFLSKATKNASTSIGKWTS